MHDRTFVMHAQKQGRMKYLLLTLIPPIFLLYLFSRFLHLGVQSENNFIIHLCTYLPILGMMILGYFLIFKKNHRIEVRDNKIIEYNWRQKEICRINVSQIYSYRRNWLSELVLMDANGNRLLCVESNMSNFHNFEQWLEIHNIH